MVKAAIFDLDGTILNTVADLAISSNVILRKYGYPEHEVPKYINWVGGGAIEMVKYALPEEQRGDVALLQKLYEEFDAHYTVHSMDHTEPYDGAVEMLRDIRARGVKTAVLSNKPHEYIPAMVDRFFPGLMDIAYGQRREYPIKPDPTALFALIDELGVRREEVVYIGDSDVDIHTGINAGLFTIGVSWGFRTKKVLEQAGATVIADKVDDLRRILVDNI